MKLGILATTALLSTICLAAPAKAANPAQVKLPQASNQMI